MRTNADTKGRQRLTLVIVGLAAAVVTAGAGSLAALEWTRASNAAASYPCTSPTLAGPGCRSLPPAPSVTPSRPSQPAENRPSQPADKPTPKTSPSRSKSPTAPAPRDRTNVGGTTAAARYGWTKLLTRDDFTGSALSASWGPYDSPGNDDQGIRSPKQISVRNGVMRMTGTRDGTTAGMYWKGSQKYGRWEVRARFPVGCGCYHPVLILWPSAENWPEGGEIDYAEVVSGSRQKLNFFLHYGADNSVIGSSTRVDMTRWHNFAVEWTPDHISGYIDGKRFFRTTDRGTFPPGPMRQTIQLDWFPGEGTRGGGILEVDWATKYAL
jgi:hypothetical protein